MWSPSLIILILVLFGIAFRQTLRIPLRIWQIVSLGALATLVSGQIRPIAAWEAIDWNVIGFLFGVFLIGEALEESGILTKVANGLHHVGSKSLYALLIFGSGIASMFLMNDTVAILGTNICIKLARHRGISLPYLLLALAFSLTIGSVMSPIGNPQNLLIAVQGDVQQPFLTFLSYLGIPTLINLILLWAIFSFFFPFKGKMGRKIAHEKKSAILTHWTLALFLALIVVKIFWSPLHLIWIALFPAALLLLFSKHRLHYLCRVDYQTLIFFAALFILMRSLWNTTPLQEFFLIHKEWIENPSSLMLLSILGSQIVSNVPLVALLLPTMSSSLSSLMTLAAGSTIAGNLLIFGAASNVIIVQYAERKKEQGLSFWQFAKLGLPITGLNFLIYWLFFSLL